MANRPTLRLLDLRAGTSQSIHNHGKSRAIRPACPSRGTGL